MQSRLDAAQEKSPWRPKVPEFNHPLTPATPKVYEAREKPERGTPLGLIRKPLAEPRMELLKSRSSSHPDRGT